MQYFAGIKKDGKAPRPFKGRGARKAIRFVIMKTITSTDISFELRITAQAGADFKKVFGKTLELL